MRFSHTLTFLLICCCEFSLGFSQGNVLTNHIPVREYGRDLPSAWAGGLTAPQFSEIDLNGDNVLDLFVFDRFDDQILTFVNGGTPNEVDYRFAPEFIPEFPRTMEEWVLLRDYDGDGYMDIFTAVASPNNIRVYRNTTASNGGNLSFTLAQDTVHSMYSARRPLFSPRSDIAAIDDVDGDGDLDIITFDTGGAFLEWHRNTSMETLGNLSGLEYELASVCYGHIKEATFGCTATVDMAPCAPGNKVSGHSSDLQGNEWVGSGQKNIGRDQADRNSERSFSLVGDGRDGDPRHVGSTLLSINLNGDSRKDFLVGDTDCNKVYALVDSDTGSVAHINLFIDSFPNYDIPVNVLTFPANFYLDLNNDGIKDLVSAPNRIGNVADERSVWWYENLGQDDAPFFEFQEIGFLQKDMIETGSGTVPVFFDYDQDGLLDLMVGNLGRFDTVSSYTPSLRVYRNTGTSASPAFDLIDDDYLGLSSLPQFADLSYVSPTFGDLDGDGDKDLLFGSREGEIWYFRNDGPSGGTANFVFVSDDYFNIDADLFTAPFLGDFDQDGDQDLLIGNIRGDVHYYENTGTVTNANFSFVTDSFGGIEITDNTGQTFTNGFARPIVVDYDLDGDPEVLVGTIEGPVEVYEGFSLIPGATFSFAGELFGWDYGAYSSPTTAVIDSTGNLTYITGTLRGGLHLVTATGFVSAEEAVEITQGSMRLFPNPAEDHVSVIINNFKGRPVFEVALIDGLGRVLKTDQSRGLEFSVDLNGIASGLYWLKVEGDGISDVKKILVK